MKRRTQKKRNTFQKKRTPRKSDKTRKKQRVSRKSSRKSSRKTKKKMKNTRKKVQDGGGDNIVTILDILLSKDVINILPTTQVFDYNKLDRYLHMIDVDTLKDIVLSNNYFRKSPTIQSIFKYTSEELQDPNKIKFEIENVDCQDLINDRNMSVKKLFLYLFECNKDVFIKENVNWFRVICGFDQLDETFEYNVMKELVEMGVFIKFDEIKEKIKLLEENLDFKLIIKKRIHSCANKPRDFFDNIFGGISFKSFNNCDKNQKQGVLYLYDEYQRFLTKDIYEELSKLDKVKILIFCEIRQHLLSKYLSLEMVRLKDKKVNKVKSILENIYKLDKDIVKENDNKLNEFKVKSNNENVLKKELKKIEDKVEMPTDNIKSEEQEIMDKMAEQKEKSDKEKGGFDEFNVDTDKKINKSGGGNLFPPPAAVPAPASELTPAPAELTPSAPALDKLFSAKPLPEDPPAEDPLAEDPLADLPAKDLMAEPATDSSSNGSDNLSSLFSTDSTPSTEDSSDASELKEEVSLISDGLTGIPEMDEEKLDLDEKLGVPKKIIPDAEKKVVTHEIYNNCKTMQNKFHNSKLVHSDDLEKIDSCEKIGLDIFIPPY